MSKDWLSLGPTPTGEDCAQVGSDEYLLRTLLECKAYHAQLINQFGEPPANTRFGVKSFPHDFGTYHEVVVYFDDENEESVEYAYRVDANLPEYWTDEFRPKDLDKNSPEQ
jgi:hypothetical protein